MSDYVLNKEQQQAVKCKILTLDVQGYFNNLNSFAFSFVTTFFTIGGHPKGD